MTKIFLLVTGIFLSTCLSGSTPDSSLYNTQFERITFQNVLENRNIDSIDLFMALDYKPVVLKDKLSLFISDLKTKTGQYTMAKKLKTVYKSVHDKYLVKYTEEAYFNDIFVNGNYNCVSASALYALVLQQMGIEFEIKEKPDHVYIIADPLHEGFLIESTLPGEKMIQFDDKVKTTYLQYLHNNKIISDDEYKNSPTDQLFEKHFLKDKNITLRELAGVHYYNRGISLFNKQAYSDALIYFEKAKLLNQSDLIGFMENNSLINLLNGDLQKKKFNGRILAKYINANDSNDTGIQYAKEYFDAVSSELAVNKPDMNAFREFFGEFSKNLHVQDSSDYYRSFYFFTGYYNTVNYQYSTALSYLSRSFSFNPENIATKQMISMAVAKAWMNDRNHLEAIDSLAYYLERFPFLKFDRNIVGYTEYCYAKAIEKLLLEEELDQSSSLLKDMERFLYKYNDFEPNKDNIILVYKQIGLYYIMDDKLDQAEQHLRRGLRLVPGAGALKEMLTQIRIMKNGSYEYPEMMADSKPLKKYLLGLAKAKDNADLIYENAVQFLAQKWKISSPAEMKLTVNLLPNDKAEVVNEKGLSGGTWNFDPKKCILTITLEKEKKSIHIIITELLPERLRGVMYQNEGYENTSEVLMIPDSVS